MGEKNPNNPYPKRTAAALIATEASAAKKRQKFIKSAKYIMSHMPEPAVSSKCLEYTPHKWPVLVGLTKGGTLKSRDVQKMTLAIVCTNGNPTNSGQQYAYTQSFLKAVKPFLPAGVSVNTDWGNFKNRGGAHPDCVEVVEALEEFVEEYIRKIEVQLSLAYVEFGDKLGKQYLELLSRKFRITGWNPNPVSVRFNAKVGESVKEEEEKTEDAKKTETSVSFVFETVPSVVPPGDSNATP